MAETRFVVQYAYEGTGWYEPSHLWEFETLDQAMEHYDHQREGSDARWRILQVTKTVVVEEQPR